MIQISQISFRDIILRDITFSDGEDLMKSLKKIGKDNIDIQDDEFKHTVRFEDRQDAFDEEEEKRRSRRKIPKVNSNYQIYRIIQKLNI